jgi:serine/threonine-protein kinase
MSIDVLNRLLVRYEELCETGEPVTPDEVCRDHPELLAEFRQALAQLERLKSTNVPDTVSDTSVPPAAGDTDLETAEVFFESRLTRFRFHKRGGLGEVYEARDPRLDRPVALKMIQAEHAQSAVQVQRFEREAWVTSQLDHPGVVPVHAAGRSSDGRPCYVMRFIGGETLDEAIQRFHAEDGPGRGPARSIALRQLLGRFIHICETIAYAHSRGIIHRDMKPANVMLGRFGETLVVDWGLAKVLTRADESAADTAEPGGAADGFATLIGARLGTPAYMSPEQAGGLTAIAGPASDIYSLGATLYDLLTGRAPFVGEYSEVMMQDVLAGRFPRPRQVRRDVPPALEAICLNAMALKPEDRYAAALDLKADLERWLADEPVSVYREPLSARVWRWSRRHRTLVAALATLLVMAVVLLVAWNIQSERARQAVATELAERQRAEAAERRTRTAMREALDLMVSGVTGDALAVQKELTPEQQRFLKSALSYYETFVTEPDQNQEGRERLAKAHYSLGWIRTRLGQAEDGADLFRRSTEQFEALAADFPDVPEYRQKLAASHRSLGVLLARLGRRPEAEAAFQTAIVLQEKLVADAPTVADYRHNLASTRNSLGGLLSDLGMRTEAADQFRRAIELREALPAVDAPHDRHGLAASHFNLGRLLAGQGKSAEAEAEYRRAIALRETLIAEFPAESDYRRGLASTYTSLAALLHRQRKGIEAEAEYRRAIALLEMLAANFPSVPQYRLELAAGHTNLGALLSEQTRLAEAEGEYRRSIELQEALAAAAPGVPEYAVDLAGTFGNLGNLLFTAGESQAALGWYAKAIARLQPVVTAEPRLVKARQFLFTSHWGQALALTKLGRYRDALADWERLLELDTGSYRTAIRLKWADALARTGDHGRAVAEAEPLAAANDASAGILYGAASVYALSAAAAKDDAALVERYGARAVALLRQAFNRGLPNVVQLLDDGDLEPLRSRGDFAELFWDLAGG